MGTSYSERNGWGRKEKRCLASVTGTVSPRYTKGFKGTYITLSYIGDLRYSVWKGAVMAYKREMRWLQKTIYVVISQESVGRKMFSYSYRVVREGSCYD